MTCKPRLIFIFGKHIIVSIPLPLQNASFFLIMLEYKIAFSLSLVIFIILVDLYSWQGLKTLLRKQSAKRLRIIQKVYFSFTALIALLFLSTIFITALQTSLYFRTYVSAILIIIYLAKLIQCIFLLVDDVQRLIRWTIKKIFPP